MAQATWHSRVVKLSGPARRSASTMSSPHRPRSTNACGETRTPVVQGDGRRSRSSSACASANSFRSGCWVAK